MRLNVLLLEGDVLSEVADVLALLPLESDDSFAVLHEVLHQVELLLVVLVLFFVVSESLRLHVDFHLVVLSLVSLLRDSLLVLDIVDARGHAASVDGHVEVLQGLSDEVFATESLGASLDLVSLVNLLAVGGIQGNVVVLSGDRNSVDLDRLSLSDLLLIHLRVLAS